MQRSVKFVKYLAEYGLRPVVVTGEHGGADFWSPEDASLLDEVPADVPVFRAPWTGSDQRLNVQGGFGGPRHKAFLEAGDRAIAAHQPELIYVSLSPYEDAYVAARLAEKHGLPWVADLRDPWALDEFQVYHTRWHRADRLRQMEVALRTAALIIMNTPEAAARFREVFLSLSDIPVTSLTNGFDAEDFAHALPVRKSEHFRIVHSGYLHTHGALHQEAHAWQYRLLGRTEPGVKQLGRSHYYLLRALEIWRQQDPEAVRQVRLALVGAQTECDRQLVEQSSVSDLVESTGYLPHPESVAWIRQADLLFLPMHTLPPGRRATIVPGKTYEYLATQRPILAAVPPGDARDFIVASGFGAICEPDDVARMLHHLQAEFRAWQTGTVRGQWNRDYVFRFERRALTKQLAAQLHQVALRALTPEWSAPGAKPCPASRN